MPLDRLIVYLTWLIRPLLWIVVATCILAVLDISSGIRKRYVAFLIKLFENIAIETTTPDHCDNKETAILRSRERSASVSSANVRSPLKNIIARPTDITKIGEFRSCERESAGRAVLVDVLYFIKSGVENIADDSVSSRFQVERLTSWNMLIRTDAIWSEFISWKVNVAYFVGLLFRYGILLPIRLCIFVIGLSSLVIGTCLVGLLPDTRWKRSLSAICSIVSFRVLARSITALISFHDRQNIAKNGGICVANHTSPIDSLILGTDSCYALIGQAQGGLIGFFQKMLARASRHIWFERSDTKDRSSVATFIRKHTEDPNNLPVLIFPEGTCINNTSIFQFKKGSFEAGRIIYPVAIKYDPRFGNAFWDSSANGFCMYLLRMMTSWAIICDVWYLPPMEKLPDESAIDFANRVKSVIANRGGLVDFEFDGQIKRQQASAKTFAAFQRQYAECLTTRSFRHSLEINDLVIDQQEYQENRDPEFSSDGTHTRKCIILHSRDETKTG